MNKILVISPTFNEKENIQRFIDSVFEFKELSLLIVDDNSPDGTADIVRSNMVNNPNIHLISRPEKLGLGTAYVDAFLWFLNSDYEYCVQMDCDFSHSFFDLKKLLNELGNFDLVIGSRYVHGGSTEGWSLHRKLLSKYANKISKFILRSNINDLTGGFRLVHKKVVSKIVESKPKSNGYTFQMEINQIVENNGFTIKEVPIIFKERVSGKSKMNFGIMIEALIYLIKKLPGKIMR